MKKLLITCAALALAIPAFAVNGGALSLIPNDAVTVGVVRIADMRSSPLSSALFQKTDEISTHGDAEAFLRDAGLQPTKDIDVVMVATSPQTTLGSNADVLIAAEGRFDVDRLTKALIARGASQSDGYLLLPTDEGRKGAVAFPSSHLALVGTSASVRQALSAYANGGTHFMTTSGLAQDIGRIDPNATAWAIVDVQRARRFANGPHISSESKQGAMLQSALKTVTTVALWATDSGDALKLGAFGLSHDAQTLQDVEDTLRGALSAMRLAVQDKQPDLVTVLRRFNVSRSDDSVTITGSVPAATFKQFAARHESK
ncbi:MAG TPA: hypothetical protein VI391_03275 [Thermoanaerobaculia bacterium]